LAALFAYESQIPKVAETKIDGLIRHYNVDGERALAYFYVHINADVEHSKAERAMLEHYVNEDSAVAVEKSVVYILEALWEMLSGVERRHPLAA
jgi:pyrroloquinoline-quinone synthase